MVLIPKGGGYYKWIGLVECIWKVYASIMNNRLRASITLHYDSHGFRQVMEAGTATMEEKLAYQLAGMVHEPIFRFY